MKSVDNASGGTRAAQTVRELAGAASIEVTPERILRGPALDALLPGGSPVYVPYLPHARFADTVDACRRLIADGLVPVPHFPARTVASRGQMNERLGALRDIGTDRLLLIAGDAPRVAGPFRSTLDVLESGLLLEHGMRSFGVAGHPEGHPQAGLAELDRALRLKQEYAANTGSDLWIVTQFAFSSGRILDWLRRLALSGNRLPIRIGIPGPARLRTLIAYAAHCGVSASARVLRRQPSAARLLTYWTPDGLLRDLAYHRGPDPLFDGIHLFPFGGVGHSSRWLRELAADDAASDSSDAARMPPA